MATRKKTKHKTNFVLSRTIWPEPKSAPADVELVIYLQSQGRAAWLCVQSLEREPRGWWGAQELSQVLPQPPWAAAAAAGAAWCCLVTDWAVPCAHQLPGLNGAELLGWLAALKTSISIWVLSHTAVHPISALSRHFSSGETLQVTSAY